MQFTVVARDNKLAVMVVNRSRRDVLQHVNAFPFKYSFRLPAEFRIFSGEQGAARQQGDLSAQMAKASSSDRTVQHDQLLWNCFSQQLPGGGPVGGGCLSLAVRDDGRCASG